MKICPTCKETYKDEDLNFCLADGATLIKKKTGVTTRHSRLNEIIAVVLLAISVLIFLSLISWNGSDWSLNGTGFGAGHKTQNWIGVVGAVMSDLLFQALGHVVAYVFPALLALIAWRVFQSESLRPRISQVIGFSFLIVSTCALTALIGGRDSGLGGIVGAATTEASVGLLGTVGATVLLLALATTSILLITNFTLTWAFGHFEVGWENLKIHFAEWKAKRREARADQINLAKERQEKRREALEAPNDSPTISIPASRKTKATKAVEMAAAAAAGSQKGFETTPAAEELFVPPSITPQERVPDTIISDEPLDGQSGSIPITPTKHTDELNGNVPPVIAEDGPQLELPKPVKTYDDYVLPSSQLLNPAAPHIEQKEKELLALADSLVEKTREFNVAGKVVNICPGPVVTTYEFKPDPGVKYSRVTGLVDDLCLALKAESVRIDRIPGKAFVGIEVPNSKRETIQLRDVIESKKFRESESLMTIALGKTIDGLNYVTDLAKMPHLLIAGATGAGKSVGVNSLIVSILYKAKPDEVKFIMVDPKRLELGVYGDIPHLATPIITDPKRAAISLKWAVTEMERRYKDLAGYGVRNIDGYNIEAKRRNALEQWDDNGDPHRTLPYIIIIIDELADLMMVSGKEVEESITRLAQMARAVGIHLVLATQRPSVDVITGLIKANFPARISFRVSSKVDSRTIIDSNGAEGLLGKGDMLFLPPASSQVIRVHGAYVDEKEIGKIVDHIKAQGRPEYDTTITQSDEEMDDGGDLPGRRDPLFWDALKCVVNAKRGSTSLLQRHLRIGYGRAAAILDAMVKEGYIGDMDGSTRARPVLSKAYEDLQDLAEMEGN
ncbi:MAG: cell division protein FtsK [Acidobacteria bacterium]|nr:MAG: cell division protein FtsK [Acidobacteriota bacterium]